MELNSPSPRHESSFPAGVCSVPPEQAAHLLSAACTHTGCGILIADNEATIQYVNPRFTEVTGYAPEEVLGKNPKMFQSGATARETYLSLWNEISSGRTWRGTLRNRKKNGELFWESITISPITDERGAITHFVAIVDDISAKVEDQAREHRIAVELSQHEKWEGFSTLAVGLAHDLNNLLTGVVAHADLARLRADAPASMHETLENIREAGMRASQLLGQLTEFTGGVPVTRVPLSLRALTRRYLSDYEDRLEGAMNLRWDATPNPCLTHGSEALLHQALLDLLRNAVEASYPGGTISVGCGYLDSESGLEPDLSLGSAPLSLPVVYLEVRDEGSGMDSETLSHAFDPFYSTKPGSKGLGLTRVHGSVLGHRGGIRVWSTPGEGTTVRIVLPALVEQ